MIPLAVGVKVYLIYFLFRRESCSVFLVQISWILKYGFEDRPI